MARIITTGPDGLTKDVGEGIFGYGTADGSLGHSAFVMPRQYAGRLRQGVFTYPYSYKSYETQEPEQGWVLENRPGIPLYPGSSARGLVLVGPSMGGLGLGEGVATGLGNGMDFLVSAAVAAALVFGALGLSYYCKE